MRVMEASTLPESAEYETATNNILTEVLSQQKWDEFKD